VLLHEYGGGPARKTISIRRCCAAFSIRSAPTGSAHRRSDPPHRRPSVGERYVDILTRHGLTELTADGELTPQPEGTGMSPADAFAARFVEVRIDDELRRLSLSLTSPDWRRPERLGCTRLGFPSVAAERRFSAILDRWWSAGISGEDGRASACPPAGR
jgi:hypothetical protein